MIQLLWLLAVWLGTVTVAVLTWPGPANGFRHELGIVMTGVAATLVVRAFATFKRGGRDPVFSFMANTHWLIYLALTVVLAVASATALATPMLIGLHVANLLVALTVRAYTGTVHAAGATRRAEKQSMQALRAAVAQLKLDSRAWPTGDRRPAIDAAIASVLDALKYAPARVVPEFESVVDDAVVVAESTTRRLRLAEQEPPEWYLSEVEEFKQFVSGQLAHLESQMSARRV